MAMTEQKKRRQERGKPDRATELDERQLEQAAGGRSDSADPDGGGEAPRRRF
jgi:hypothetical protein